MLQLSLHLLCLSRLGEVKQHMQVSGTNEVLATVDNPRDDRDDGCGSAMPPQRRAGMSLTDDAENDDRVVHVVARDRQVRREEEEHGSEDGERDADLWVSERSCGLVGATDDVGDGSQNGTEGECRLRRVWKV